LEFYPFEDRSPLLRRGSGFAATPVPRFELDHNKRIGYYILMIRSFRCKETEKVFRRVFSKRFPRSIQQRAFMKLNAIDAAIDIDDLRLPGSNRLATLKGDRKGQWSIRINDRWRICFEWQAGDAERVEIVDYH